MPVSVTWPLAPDAASAAETAGLVGRGQPKFLGRGIVLPFRRDAKSDFANDTGLAVIKASIRQILLTQARTPQGGGEIPWRVDFGSWLHLVRHRRNAVVTRELVRVYVVDALTRWEPRVRLSTIEVTQPATDQHAIQIRLVYDVVDRNNSLIATDEQVELPLLTA